MSFNLPIVFLACLAVGLGQYNPYSPHPPANARDPSFQSRSSSTYNRAQDFRAAGKNPGYRSSFTLPSKQGSYGQRQGQLNGASSYNGGFQRASAYNGQQKIAFGYGSMENQGSLSYNRGESAQVASSHGNGLYYGGQQDGSYDDMAQPSADDPDGDSIVGVAGADYPTYSEIPKTSFECSQQQFPGLYADTEAQCQVFHICQDGGRYDSFLCPNGSIFNQQYFVCDWWYNVDCQSAPSFYGFNADLYKDVNQHSAAASYAANLPSGSQAYAIGHGSSATYGSATSSDSRNGIGMGPAKTGYGNGNGNGNDRLHSEVLPSYITGNGRGYSVPSSAYNNGNGRAAAKISSANTNGNGRGSSGLSTAYGNGRVLSGTASTIDIGNGRGGNGASSPVVNGNGRGGSGISSYGNDNGRGHSVTSSSYGSNNNIDHSRASLAHGNDNGRRKTGKSAAQGNAILASGSSHTSNHVNKHIQHDDYSIADMPPLGY